MPCRWSDSPLPLPLVRRPIGPKYHWSDGPLLLVRKPIALVRRLIGPKKCHCHAIWHCHWSENHWLHFSGQMVFGPMTLFRTNGSSDQWVFGPMGFRPDQWVFGRTNGFSGNGLSDIETSPLWYNVPEFSHTHASYSYNL